MWQKNNIFYKFILSVALSLIVFNSHASYVKAINHFDVSRYAGTWYEIARLPNFFEKHCHPPIIAEYSLNAENKVIVTNSCRNEEGILSKAEGIATFVGNPNEAKLTVSFLPRLLRWLPFTSGDYWVLYTDYDHYALVGSPNQSYLWILSRTEKTNPKEIQFLVDLAKSQGFVTDELIFNN